MDGDSIYNRIVYETNTIDNEKAEVWMMQQQQGQYDSHFQKWDRLAIVVKPYQKTVQFFQLQPGKLEWTQDTLQGAIPHKVNCLMCHTNGPRAIRPDPSHPLSLRSKILVTLWNRHIARSPKLTTVPAFNIPENSKEKTLQVKACAKCHNEDEDGRHFLTPANRFSILFMLQNRIMPPQQGTLTKNELAEIVKFLN